jgi:cytochrome c biogenesis protein CcdA
MLVAETWGMLLVYGAVDALNPATILTVLLLLPNVRHRWHVTVFIGTTYVTYLLLGLASVYGVNQFMADWVRHIFNQYRQLITYLELGIGVLLLFAFVGGLIWLGRSGWGSDSADDRATSLPKTTTGYMVLLGIGSTMQDFPTALPYFGFIVWLVARLYNPLMVFGLLMVYVGIYIAPMVILQLVYNRFESRFITVAATVQRWMQVALRYGPVVLMAGGSAFLLWDSLTRLSLPD